MSGPDATGDQRPALDFDGDYGRTYRQSIRHSVPGYDSLIELATAALLQAVPDAARLLVVGPGPGEELIPLLEAFPEAQFTLLEPSRQMREACGALIAAAGAEVRCTVLDQGLEPGQPAPGGPYAAVVCHNVLHLLPPPQQQEMLQSLAAAVPAGGVLLLSSHSESSSGAAFDTLLAIAGTRLRQRGMPAALIEQLMASRNQLVFSLEQSHLEAVLAGAGLEPPLLLQQSLFSRLWISRRAG